MPYFFVDEMWEVLFYNILRSTFKISCVEFATLIKPSLISCVNDTIFNLLAHFGSHLNRAASPVNDFVRDAIMPT